MVLVNGFFNAAQYGREKIARNVGDNDTNQIRFFTLQTPGNMAGGITELVDCLIDPLLDFRAYILLSVQNSRNAGDRYSGSFGNIFDLDIQLTTT